MTRSGQNRQEVPVADSLYRPWEGFQTCLQSVWEEETVTSSLADPCAVFNGDLLLSPPRKLLDPITLISVLGTKSGLKSRLRTITQSLLTLQSREHVASYTETKTEINVWSEYLSIQVTSTGNVNKASVDFLLKLPKAKEGEFVVRIPRSHCSARFFLFPHSLRVKGELGTYRCGRGLVKAPPSSSSAAAQQHKRLICGPIRHRSVYLTKMQDMATRLLISLCYTTLLFTLAQGRPLSIHN